MESSKSKKQTTKNQQSQDDAKTQPSQQNDRWSLERSGNDHLSSSNQPGTDPNNISENKNPETEVPANAKRRRFTANYKLKILQEVDNATTTGDIGAILRREGLYSSHLAKWRELRDSGTLKALGAKKRGPKTAPKNPLQKELNNLEKENRHLKKRLIRAEKLIELQKKVAALLDDIMPTTDRNGSA